VKQRISVSTHIGLVAVRPSGPELVQIRIVTVYMPGMDKSSIRGNQVRRGPVALCSGRLYQTYRYWQYYSVDVPVRRQGQGST